MTIHTAAFAPQFAELNCSNHLLGDLEALAAAWDRDGYWFFRDVLDKQVIARIRQAYIQHLVKLGVTNPNDPEHRYNGAEYPAAANINDVELNAAKTHKLLHEAPTINAFFSRLFGCDPFWVPFTVHRTNPPVRERGRTRFDFIHEDGIYNDGLPFLICWVPLDEIDEETGGIAVAEGLHKGPCLHRRDGMTIYPIELEAIPPTAWRRAHYRPGDVLLMSLRTPHSGLANLSSDRFRLSMDTRVMPSTGKVPKVGVVRRVSASGVTVEDAAGQHELIFDSASFVRGFRGDQMPIEDVPSRYKPWTEVIVAVDGDRVTNMRPQT